MEAEGEGVLLSWDCYGFCVYCGTQRCVSHAFS